MKGRRSTSTTKKTPRADRVIDRLEPRVLLSAGMLVQDINLTTEMLAFASPTVVGNRAYFAGHGVDGTGYELWKTDGTTAGTVQVKDINPGLPGSDPANFTDVGGIVYFTARDPDAGMELWKSDGTAAGTVRVKDINPGTGDSAAKSLTAVGNTLYFTATDGISGVELWKSDGTDAGTVLVKDIYPGSTNSSPQYLVPYNGAVLFAATDSPSGRELWRSDGTDAGTTRVADIASGFSSSSPRYLVPFAGAVYFTADGSGSGGRGDLYRTDGTAGGTTRVYDVVYTSGTGTDYGTIANITPSGDRLYFLAGNANTGRYDLWRSDGTAAGTSLLLGGSTFLSNAPLVAAGQRSVVFTNNTAAAGAEPWVSDGTVAGTMMLKDVIPGTASGLAEVMYGRVGNTVYFAPNRLTDAVNDLWKTDLTPAGTVKVTNVASAGGYLTWPVALGGKLLFSGTRYAGTGDLYVSDGTAAGTVRVGAAAQGNSSGMQEYPVFSASFARVGETMYFGATDGIHGRELWRTKAGAAPGTLAGAEMVADLSPGGFPSDPGDFFSAPDGSLYFKGNTPALGAELYRLAPGAGAVPQLVSDFNPGPANSAPLVVGAIGGTVYVWANDATGTAFMWRYNPTAGTLAKMTAPNGGAISRPGTMVTMGGYAYFAGYTSNTGSELWRTDGSSTTAELVKDINSLSSDSFPSLLTVAGNTLYFAARDGIAGTELWKSDGTANGTVLLADITPGGSSSSTTFNAMYALNGVVYFDAQPGTSGAPDRLWRSDGTAAGTYELAPLQTPRQFANLSGKLYFVADDDQGRAVFRYDPSDPAPVPVRLTPTTTGNFVLRPTALVAAGTRVYFVALAGTGRGDHYELWQTDGSTGGTKKVRDVQPVVSAGTTPSIGTYFVSGFYALGANSTHLFFPAWTPELGQELYALPLVDPAGAIRGSVFDDRNRNGVRDAGEPGVAGRTVFGDLDNDGSLDDAEPVATTDASGNYALTALDPGTYAVRQVVPTGWLATGAAAPRGVTVATAPVDGVNFSVTDVAPPNIQSGVPASERPDCALRFTFSEDVGASLSAADLRIVTVPGGAALDSSKFAVTFDPAILTATFTFPGYPGGRLPDGNYRATLLAAGVTDPTGNPAAADYAVDFFVLGGDANRDRVVNFNDLLVLASNYNKAGVSYAQGDFTGDGVVNFNDLLILAANYNKAIPAPALPPAPVAASAAPLGSAALAVATADAAPADRTRSQSKVFNAKTPITRPAPPSKPVKAAKRAK